ncbi:tRNA pseudouridine(55) synthase TruB [Solimonas soli]|uniref:tRNA pseudouridine(55) synthase TruB n=1 Tax=Solimonas soli TaxID=413479 RepID=UPI000488440E|nr:tRNA pseudouridine(55) synthase TruB [Solimonas soli]
MAVHSRPPRRRISGVLLLDKPLDLSSNDALQRVKRLFRAEKAGHTGSLDPLATGMLPICLGEATKLSGVLLESDKRYRATVSVGTQTSTGDAEGEVIARSDAGMLDEARLRAAIAGFIGKQKQIPPMYSALKRDGRPLYELARRGESVEREAREIVIRELRLLSFEPGRFEIEVCCSKGTYIRTLAEDLAGAVGQRAHLSSLRRTGVAPFWRHAMVGLDALEAEAASGGAAALDAHLLGCAAALAHWPSLTVDAVRAQALSRGRAQRIAGVVRDARLAVLDERGFLLGLAESDAEGWVRPQRWLQAPPQDDSGS